jgi:hypothetical protein
MRNTIALLFLFLFFAGTVTGQVFRFRLSANSGAYLGEPGEAEIDYPMKDELSYPGSRGFSPIFHPGAELEISTPLTIDSEFGLQFGYNRFAGYTPKAPLYNFFLSRFNPLPDHHKYPGEELIFDSRVLSTLATFRWFFLSYDGTLNFFMKLFGGVAFTGSDFNFRDPVYSVEYDVGVLYARGTRNSEDPKLPGFKGGAGFGATYRLSEELDICFDAALSFIHSDLINGVPNYNYTVLNGDGIMEPNNCYSAVAHLSVGILFSAIPDKRYRENNITRALNQDKTLFEKRARRRPYSKRRR